MGAGHGYAAVWSTMWNINATSSCVCVQNPPVGANWGVGITASTVTGLWGKCCPYNATVGYIDNQAGAMDMPSLYLAQLQARKAGKQPILFADSSAPILVQVQQQVVDQESAEAESFLEVEEDLEMEEDMEMEEELEMEDEYEDN
eukprot:TRINITY_DN3949_c0_g1_i8.p1 TRINITY_DN3949_c0_g1~~TRINITY_DN3949_c0_g1_i8.p1  ORF type:complete len:145 (+),score=64.58 TRINITY_DN3949_c0_g1_i8:67-501(+)